MLIPLPVLVASVAGRPYHDRSKTVGSQERDKKPGQLG